MAWMRESVVLLWAGLFAAAASGCGDDGGGAATPSTTGSTGPVTTFTPTSGATEPIDPSASPTDSSGPAVDSTDAPQTDTGDDTTTTTGDPGSSSSSGGDAAPSVQQTDPADFESGVEPGVPVMVEFSEPMDPATVTTNTRATNCSGTLQLSADGFATCVQMMAAPTSADGIGFSVEPAVPLDSATTYQIRVLATVTDASGTPMDADFTTGTGFSIRYFHTIAIDGNNDFSIGETFASSTAGHTGYVAWDDDFVYLGLDSPDLLVDTDQVWWVAYVGGLMGSAQGVTYNTQSPMLPFDARWHLRWRTDGTFASALTWTGAAWVDAAFPIEATDTAVAGTFVEMRVSRLDIGSPDYLDLHLGLLREEALNEASWAAVPQGSHVDGYDPDFGQFHQFDLASSLLPADVLPLP